MTEHRIRCPLSVARALPETSDVLLRLTIDYESKNDRSDRRPHRRGDPPRTRRQRVCLARPQARARRLVPERADSPPSRDGCASFAARNKHEPTGQHDDTERDHCCASADARNIDDGDCHDDATSSHRRNRDRRTESCRKEPDRKDSLISAAGDRLRSHPPLPTPPDDDPIKRFPPHPDKPYVEIAFADVNWLQGKKVLFLDARRTSVYEQGHISGARPYSVWESDIDDKVRKLFDERGDPQSQSLPIVIYCSGGDCEDSHMLAQKLYGALFNNVYVYKDGFPDWQKRGGAVHTGVEP